MDRDTNHSLIHAVGKSSRLEDQVRRQQLDRGCGSPRSKPAAGNGPRPAPAAVSRPQEQSVVWAAAPSPHMLAPAQTPATPSAPARHSHPCFHAVAILPALCASHLYRGMPSLGINQCKACTSIQLLYFYVLGPVNLWPCHVAAICKCNCQLLRG